MTASSSGLMATPRGRWTVITAVAGALIALSFFLPWANSGDAAPSGLAIAQSAAALSGLGSESLALNWLLFLVPLAGLIVLGAAWLRQSFAAPLMIGALFAAFIAATIYLVLLGRTPVVTGVLTDDNLANDSLLPFLGIGVWLFLLSTFVALFGSFNALSASMPSGALLNTQRIVTAGILGSIAVTLGVTRLGFIPVPNATGNATIMHVPAIIGAAIDGPVVAIVAGGIFGLFSMLQDTTGLFGNPLVSVVPRLLIGLVAWLVFRATRRFGLDAAAIAAGIAGTLTNTIGVVGMLILFQLLPVAVIPLLLPQVLFEVVLAAVLTPLVVRGVTLTRSGRTLAEETTPREKSFF